MDNFYQVIIIGAGPAGVAAAIQLKRFGIDFLHIEKDEIGGLLNNANLVENYMGFPEGIKGKDLTEYFKKHIQRLSVSIIKEKVLKADYANIFLIETDKNTYKSEYLIIATGTNPRKLVLISNNSNRIFYEIKNLPEIKNNTIVIIGGGDAAFDYAINLSANNNVFVLNRSKTTKCLPLLFDRVSKIKNIKYFENTEVLDFKESNNKIIFNTNNKELSMIEADYLIVAIGREPNIDFLGEGLVKLKNNLDNKKLFFIGDLKNENYRQASIAAGDGIKAAMTIYNNIIEE